MLLFSLFLYLECCSLYSLPRISLFILQTQLKSYLLSSRRVFAIPNPCNPSHSPGHMYWPILLPQCLPHFSASSLRPWTVSRKQLLTCELLERGVGLHAKPLAVLIERLQPQLSRFLDDFHGHVQDVVVYVPTPTNLPRDKYSRGLRAWPHCPGKELQVRSPS